MDKRKEAARKKSLGELGELFAIKTLVDCEYDKIRNLNDVTMNESFADIYCEKDGKRYVISVKARNKYQVDGSLNSRYNLGTNAYEKAGKQPRSIMPSHTGWLYSLMPTIILYSWALLIVSTVPQAFL